MNATRASRLPPIVRINAFELITMLGGLDLTLMFDKDEHAQTKLTRFAAKVRVARAAFARRSLARAARRARAPQRARSRARAAAVCLRARRGAQLPAATLTAEMTRVLDEMGLKYEKATQFKLKISFQADHGPATATAQVFVMAPGLHMVDFRRGQSDFFAFFKLFNSIKERLLHVINSDEFSPPHSPAAVPRSGEEQSAAL